MISAESESGARRVLAFLPATPGDGLYSPGGVVSRFIFRVSTAKADYYTGHETRACAPVPARLQPRRASRDRMFGKARKTYTVTEIVSHRYAQHLRGQYYYDVYEYVQVPGAISTDYAAVCTR